MGRDWTRPKSTECSGAQGQKSGDAYKLSFPRADLQVTVQGVTIKPGLALGSWAGFMGDDSDAIVMGDPVLLQDELNPVMEKPRKSGLEITSIHNHLINETPQVIYMHYMGRGKATELAESLKAALGASKTPLGKPTPPTAKAIAPEFVQTVEKVMGREGSFNNGVLGYGISRSDTVTTHGMTVPSALGLAETINFQEASPGKVATTGDFVLTSDEVNPVIDALHEHHILVTALHNHMLDEQPRLFFMHFWGLGDPKSVADGIKTALDRVRAK